MDKVKATHLSSFFTLVTCMSQSWQVVLATAFVTCFESSVRTTLSLFGLVRLFLTQFKKSQWHINACQLRHLFLYIIFSVLLTKTLTQMCFELNHTATCAGFRIGINTDPPVTHYTVSGPLRPSHDNPSPHETGHFGDDSPASEIFWNYSHLSAARNLLQTSVSAATLLTGLSECAGSGPEPPPRCVLLSQTQAHPVTASGWSHWAKSGP